jgi:hypothetical protein
MNRITVIVGISIIVAGAVLIGNGFLERDIYENCLKWLEEHYMDTGTSVPLQCQSDQSPTFFLAGLLTKIVGIVILLLGLNGLPLLPSFNPQPQCNHHPTLDREEITR